MSKKQLFSIEFPVRCSPQILFEFIGTPAGLQEWFADEVNEKDGAYYFSWSGDAPDRAEILERVQDKVIRFRWDYSEPTEFFELKIERSEISNQTVLVIKDFAEKKDIKDQSQLWEYQVKDLFHRIGS